VLCSGEWVGFAGQGGEGSADLGEIGVEVATGD
jgi:hypothetical protein